MARVIGVLGGMGPEATADFFVKLIRCTPARCDAEHLHVVVDSNPQIPDRTAFIEKRGPSPAPALVAAARTLVRAGADVLTMPCITAHLFIDEIRDAVDVAVLSALEVTARHVDATYDPGDALALLASTGTLRVRLFQRAMPGRTFVLPTDVEQTDVVMRAVYGPDGVKTVGVDARTRERMQACVETLAARGARAVVAGCTEFSVLFAGVALAAPLVDPMELLAEEAVRTARE